VTLIKKGLAYVDSLPPEKIKEYRGDWNTPGRESPYRNRSVEENLELFERMRRGEFKEGECVLRAKIDMRSPNMNLRDPVLYRIIHAPHYRQGAKWCLYPTYDMAHGQCDAIEGITHSICTLEFEDHRPLYEWLLKAIGLPEPHPKQIEFARLELTYTVLSKRRLIELVEGGYVAGWDDPRMPTLSGMRRRGYPPEAIRRFCREIGVSKVNAVVPLERLEECVRDVLNKTAPRRLAVRGGHPEDPLLPGDLHRARGLHRGAAAEVLPPGAGARGAPAIRVLHQVRRRHKRREGGGRRAALHLRPRDQGREGPRRPQGEGHHPLGFRGARGAVDAEVRLYDRLFLKEDPTDVPEGVDWKTNVNPNSLEVLYPCKLEPSLAEAKPGERFQFERLGYFCVDPDSTPERLVFNRTVTLKDEWAKLKQKTKGKAA